MEATQERILGAAARLLAQGGEDAASTRAVSAAAGVQAPAIYRLFGDKQGLLDAAAVHVFTVYAAAKAAAEPGPDPVVDLRAGWDAHIAFGLANPHVYALVYGRPRPDGLPPAAAAAQQTLVHHVRRIAQAGRLALPEPRAVQLVHAAGSGTVLALLATPEGERDPGLSPAAREATLTAITRDAPAASDAGAAGAAVTLRAALGPDDGLTRGERGVLREWLDRLAGA